MNIKDLSKKDLKNYINENGFFFHMQCDKLEKENIDSLLADTSLNMMNTGVVVPTGEDVIVYRGIASQNYGVGEKSRNGYKYDQTGWSMTDYFINPVVLFQHDHNQPIGNATSFWLDNENNLNIMFFVYKDALDGTDKVRVEKGLIKAISTGAMTDEYMFEEIETGLRITEEEAEEKYGWGNLFDAYFGCSEFLILVITKATMVENSLVTIGSNEKAMAVQNGIGKFFESKADALKEKLGDKINERKTPVKNDLEESSEPVGDIIAEIETKMEEDNIEVTAKEEEVTTKVTTETTVEAEQTEEKVEIEEEINTIQENDGDKEPLEPEEKEPVEGSEDAAKEGDKCTMGDGSEGTMQKGDDGKMVCMMNNSLNEPITESLNPETEITQNNIKISENQDEKPEIIETVEQTEEVIEQDTPAENAEKNIEVDDFKARFFLFTEGVTKDLEEKFNIKTTELENSFNSRIEEQDKVLEESIGLINKVLEFVENESSNNKVIMDRLKQNVIDGVPIINQNKKISNHPLAGRVNGLEKIMGLDN